MDDLFEDIRAACSPKVWSRGVELARGEHVIGESLGGGSLRLRVRIPGVSVSPIVHLHTDDGDWQCSCQGADDPCAHVAAAAIALRRAKEAGRELPGAKSSAGCLAYRLRRSPSGLLFERAVVASRAEPEAAGDRSKEVLLEVSLAALTSGRVKGPVLTATAEDLAVDLALATPRRGLLPATTWPKLLGALADAAAAGSVLTLDDAPVAIDPRPIGQILEVLDDAPGVRLRLMDDPDIKEKFANGVALTASGLRPLQGRLPLPADEEQALRAGRFCGRQDFGDLVTTVLPQFEELIPLRVHSRLLPPLARTTGRPRLELCLTHHGQDGLVVTAAIVYGSPTAARVRHGRLELLGNQEAQAPRRDLDHERRLRDELSRSLGLALDQPVTLDTAAALAFTANLAGFAGDIVGPAATAFKLVGALTPHIKVGADPAALVGFGCGETGGGGLQADPHRVLAAWKAGESLVSLADGQGWARIPQAWLDAHGDAVLDLLNQRSQRSQGTEGSDGARGPSVGAPSIALLPAIAALGKSLGVAPDAALLGDDAMVRVHKGLEGLVELPAHPLPAGSSVALRSYQRRGVNWLAFHKTHGLGALLADDMGLGKTVQTLLVMHPGERALIVAPTSVVFNWQAELRRFRPDLRICIYHGAQRRLDLEADCVVTTYALARLDQEALAAPVWDLLVLDEAQNLKNPDSQVRRALAQVTAKARIALSGTPVENRLEDLWSLMDLLNPGLLGERSVFQERFARPIAKNDVRSAARAAALHARVRPFILRRLKGEVLPELPPRTEIIRHVELSERERQHYEVIKAATRRDVLERLEQGVSIMAALEALLRLRQACCHPDLLPGISGEASSKLGVLRQILEETQAEGHKTLVFSQWTSFLDLIGEDLRQAGIAFLRLDGATADRQGVVAKFQAPDGPSVLIMSLKAGGVGLNLTAADHVIIADPWWNPAAEDQAADRAHRIGQNRPVLIQRLVALNSVEERILALQEQKRQMAAAALHAQAPANAASSLSRNDILALLQ